MRVSWVLAVGWLNFSVCAAELDLSALPPPATNQVNFASDIKPILEQSCLRCHGPERPKGGFRLDNRESALKGGHDGEVIIPGNSAKSRLIHYVGRLDPEMAMPPEGEGDPLTSGQVSLLRAWIDQGAAWGEAEATRVAFGIAPAFGYAWVDGNEAKFREHWWMRGGHRAGVEWFELSEQYSPDTRLTLSGHAMTDDYRAALLLEKRELGFANFGFEQFRKYDSDTGGYYPDFSQPSFSLDQNLHLDIGRAWFDFGLTRPDWPRMVLGYEYQYRNGDKSTLQWGPVTEGFESDGITPRTRAVYPSLKQIDEHTHLLKFDFDFERSGWRMEDNFRGEWTEFHTKRNNVSGYDLATPNSMITDTVREGWKAFQGANTVRVERPIRSWLFASAGYLYSHLSGDADFSLDTANPDSTPAQPLPISPFYLRLEQRSQSIVLERDSHVGNLNALFGPWQGGSLALGVQGERTRQNGTMEGTETFFIAPPFNGPPFNFPDEILPVRAFSDLERTVLDESAVLRFTRLPFTTLFAETRLQQEWIGQVEDVTGHHSFARDTDADSDIFEVRTGFDTSPRSWVKLGFHYRWRDESTDYDDGFAPGDPADLIGYPTFISARDLTTQEFQSRLTLRPRNWFKTTLTHRWVESEFHTRTEPVSLGAPGDVSTGGRVQAGDYDAQIFSLNFTLTPWRRMNWFTTVAYQDVRSVALHDNSAAVAPYRGDTWSVLCHGRYLLTARTDLTAGYSFSRADFSQDNYADGLPVGMRYDLHGLQAGIVSRCTKHLTTKLQYGFYHYDEPSSGGANDYSAHTVFVSLALRFD